MFDVGSWEFFLVLLLALVIIGPKDLPIAIRTVTRWVRHIGMLAQEFKNAIEDLELKADVDEIKTKFVDDDELTELQRQFNENSYFSDEKGENNILLEGNPNSQNVKEKLQQIEKTSTEDIGSNSQASQGLNSEKKISKQKQK